MTLPMEAKADQPLSPAETYCQNVLNLMSDNPGDCALYTFLSKAVGNNPLVVFNGKNGGSLKLSLNYLQQLQAIHNPHCSQQGH